MEIQVVMPTTKVARRIYFLMIENSKRDVPWLSIISFDSAISSGIKGTADSQSFIRLRVGQTSCRTSRCANASYFPDSRADVGRRSGGSKGGEIHDDVTMVRTNSQGHLARASPDSIGPPKMNRYSHAIGSFDQSTDLATEQKQKDTKSPLYIIASYDSNDNSLLQSRLSFPPAHKMVTEGSITLSNSGTPPRPSSGDEYIDAYQQAVSKYNSKLTPASPARSTKSSATAETAALSRTSTPANSPARSASKPPSISTGSSSTENKKSRSSSTGGGLKNLVRMPSLRKARSMGRSASLKAMFSTTKAAGDNIDTRDQVERWD